MMKKVVLMLLTILCISSCAEKNNPEQKTKSISCSPSSITTNGNSSQYNLTLESISAWMATSNRSWVTVSPSSGSGSAFLTITVGSGSTDSAQIMFSNATESIIVPVRRVVSSGGVEQGRAYVDLGLSVYWATTNVGTSIPTEVGNFYAWGETTPRGENYYYLNQYKYYSSGSYTKYVTESKYGTIDNKTTLESSDDVATMQWGGKWRMPTLSEITELCKNCTIKQEGKGRRITAPNGNSIYLPWATYYYKGASSFYANTCGYWSSSLDLDSGGNAGGKNACYLSLDGDLILMDIWHGERVIGMLIRPVCAK